MLKFIYSELIAPENPPNNLRGVPGNANELVIYWDVSIIIRQDVPINVAWHVVGVFSMFFSQSFSQSVIYQAVSQSFSQSFIQSVIHSVSHSFSQSVIQLVS